MPLLSIAESEILSNNQLEAGVVEEIIDKEDLFAVLPFTGVNGKAYVYNRELTLATGNWVDPNQIIQESHSTFQEVVTKLRILAGDVDVDKFIDSTLSDTNGQKTLQIAQKAKGLSRQFKQTLMTGNTAIDAKQFDGLASIAESITVGDASRTIDAGVNGASVDLALLDQLLDAVPNGADAIFMHPALIRGFRGVLRSVGTDAAAELMMPNFGRPMLTHNGVPILANDFIPLNETQGTTVGATTSAYAVRLNEVDGLHGIYGGGLRGVVVEDIGTVQNKDATRTRLKWYVSLVLKSTKSLARLKGLTNIA